MQIKIVTSNLIVSFLVLGALACSSGGFEGSPQRAKVEPVKEPKTEEAIVDPQPIKKEEVFSLQTQKTNLDMVWVIDNSGSMSEEAEKVRENFASFLKNVENSTNLNLALISASTAQKVRTGVDLPAEAKAKGYIQLENAVGSWNSLSILASAVCPASSTDIDTNATTEQRSRLGSSAKICNLTEVAGRNIEHPEQIKNLAGSLTGFFRPEATKAFVFVTDDNAEDLSADEFSLALSQADDPIQPIVYAFDGIPENNTCATNGGRIANVGEVYNELTTITKGQSFDLCAANWSSHFNKLTESIVAKANSKFELQNLPVTGSIEVKVGDKVLDTSLYTVLGSQVTIDENTLLEAGDVAITISYEAR